jgi:hypothetical protein
LETSDPLRTVHIVVHEATHAIQDWKDVDSSRHTSEADAFIAGAAFSLASGDPFPQDQNERIPATAARLVLNNRAGAHQEWRTAYLNVVELMKQFYPATPVPKSREAVVEREVFARIVSRLDAYDAMRASSAALERQMAGIDLARYASPARR